jgi:hypothetical protein
MFFVSVPLRIMVIRMNETSFLNALLAIKCPSVIIAQRALFDGSTESTATIFY